VAVHDAARLVDHYHPVAVAVERDADLRFQRRYGLLQQPRGRRAAARVDVAPVRRAADGDDFRPEAGQRPRTDLVGGAVRAVEHDLHAFQAVAGRERGGAELLVADPRRTDALRPPELVRFEGDGRLPEVLLDRRLLLVGELLARAGEELDPVVLVRVVRRADHDPDVGAELLREVGDAGGRQRA